MSVDLIVKLACTIALFLISVISSIIGWCKARKASKKATTAEEEAIAHQKMQDEAVRLIEEAETFYKSLDTILRKTDGTTAGSFKKESVMVKLESYANTIKTAFDKEYWSEIVDALVKFTKGVNK